MWLCDGHHNMSNAGVHFNKELNIKLRQVAQQHFEDNIGTRLEFRQEFGKSYL